MVAITLAFAVLEPGGGASAVGLVLACRMFPLVAPLLVGGVVADRSSRRMLMVVADALRFLTPGLMAPLLIAAEIWMLAVLAGLTGAAGGVFNPAARPRGAYGAGPLRSGNQAWSGWPRSSGVTTA